MLFADAIMALGFRHAFQAGISFGKDDMIIPDSEGCRWSTRPRALVDDYEQQYQDGLITQQEKYNKVIDAWCRCGDQRGGRHDGRNPRRAPKDRRRAARSRSTRST